MNTQGSNLYEQLVEFQRNLTLEPDYNRIPDLILNMIRESMGAENVMIVGVEGDILGQWWIRNEGSKVTTHSMDVIRNALANGRGCWRGGIAEDPLKASDSQRKDNIFSCLAARINMSGRTLGAIYCDIREGQHRFQEGDGERLKMIADVFAVYVDYFAKDQLQEQKKKRPTDDFNVVLGDTIAVKTLRADLAAAAKLSSSVLLQGESGVGKEVAARYIHGMSQRTSGPFVAIHCAAIPKDLLESELFGHEKGAFSGAYRKHRGRIELANHGTLFLDEVGDIPMEFQVKLLRVLEDKKVWPVGSEAEIGPFDFRLICSSNRPIKTMVDEKTFRQDLFYRISGMQIHIPSLRDRIADVSLLALYFASRGESPKSIDEDAIELLKSVDWPGNVRQLRAVIENARDLTLGQAITRDAVAKQLAYQHMSEKTLPKQSEVSLTFEEIQRQWNSGELNATELQNLIIPLYLKCNKNLNAVGRQLNCRTPQELREFRNFIYYRRKNELIILPD